MPEEMSAQFSYTIEYIQDDDFFWISYFGAPNLNEFSEVFIALRNDKDYKDHIDVLLDVRKGSGKKLTKVDFNRVQSYLAMQKDRHHIRQACVVNSDLDFGLFRMNDISFEESVPQSRRVFRNLEEALQWLRPDSVQNHVNDEDT